jgi:hypothetical protein
MVGTMFERRRIVKRGEIPERVIGARRKLGIATVAVYLQADRESLPVRIAERTVWIGPPPATASSAGIAAGLNRLCAVSAQTFRHIQRAVGRLGNRPCCGFHDFAAAGDNKVVRMPELDWPIELTSSRRELYVGS